MPTKLPAPDQVGHRRRLPVLFDMHTPERLTALGSVAATASSKIVHWLLNNCLILSLIPGNEMPQNNAFAS